MPSIAGSSTVSFISLAGQTQEPGLIVEDVSRPGVDGHAYREMQRSAKPFEMIGTRDCSNVSDAESKLATLRGMLGTSVTVTDDVGTTTTSVMLLEVEKQKVQKISGAVGGVQAGGATALLIVRLLLQVAVVP